MSSDPGAPDFAGFPPEAFAWFAGLEDDNSRRYFTANRVIYDTTVRGPVEALLEELADELGGRVRVIRQHRDVRFSADKSPYKTRTYGVVEDRPDTLSPLYLELSSTGLFAGTGFYMLDPGRLARLREAVDDETAGTALQRAIAAAHAGGLETFGQVLKTAPRGFARDHPRVELLRYKALFTGARLAPSDDGISRDAALAHARTCLAAAAPLCAWLDEHVGAATAPVRRGR